MSAIIGGFGLAAFLPGLLCVGGMVFCMKMMGSHSKAVKDTTSASAAPKSSTTGVLNSRIEKLENELTRLRAQNDGADAPLA
ncbi:MAG: hypothetical protein ACHP7H_00975 [Hyphomicrobiales bacterium]